MMIRRAFLKSSGVALFGTGLIPTWLARGAADASGRRKVLVAIFQRGAADALNIIVPHGDPAYYALRPAIGIPRERLIDLDGKFGFHPALQPIASWFPQGTLAVVHAVGSPDPTRSHFDAQDFLESGTPGVKSTASGWLNRALSPRRAASPLRAVSMGRKLARTLRGDHPAVAISSLEEFRVREGGRGAIESLDSQSADPAVRIAARETGEAIRLIESLGAQGPRNGAQYPPGRFGSSLRDIALLIHADVGLEAAFAEIGGWDHHAGEVGGTIDQGPLAARLREFAAGLAAFERDLGDRWEDVAVVTMSEFGRSARENGTRGTDHGHGGAMLVCGGSVKGGRVLGRWPGLERDQLHEQRDLAVTTDFREVLTELARAQFGLASPALFPGFRFAGKLGIA